MRLSIVIPAFNEEKIIGQTLRQTIVALNENEAEDFRWEIIVCDNNSTDQTAAIASEAGAIVVFEPINHISKARNRGASAARGEWLLFMDADTYPLPGMISEVLDLIAANKHVGCGSTIKVVDAPRWYRLNFEGHNWEWRLFKTCIGVFMLSKADAYRAIGGFSDDLYAFEDLDFILRLKKYGKKIGKEFEVLHRFPVIMSGRKAHLYDKWTMTKSSLIGLYYFLTKRKLANSKALPFWYDGRR